MNFIKSLKNIFMKTDNFQQSYYCRYPSSSVIGFLEILKKHNYNKLDFKDNWLLYIPNGYNRIEIDLMKLETKSDKQIIFGIQGCDQLVGKSWLWRRLEKKYGRDISSKILPETYILTNEDHINLFKNKYDENNIYILKNKCQGKNGILLTRDINEILEAKNKNYTIVQDYKRDTLLINKRKLNLRIYLLLIMKNGIVNGYINKFGTCIYSNKDYNDSTFDVESNITSVNLDNSIYNKNPLTINQLKTYLSDNNQDINKIFNSINDKVYMVIDAVKDSLGKWGNLKNNLCLQIFGMDFIVDNDLNAFMLECNKGPVMRPSIEYDSVDDILNNIEIFHELENNKDKCYPSGYIPGNGFKVKKDALSLLNIIKCENKNNGFYKIY